MKFEFSACEVASIERFESLALQEAWQERIHLLRSRITDEEYEAELHAELQDTLNN